MIRPLGRARSDGPGCGLVSGMRCSRLGCLEVPAKSFVSRRWSNFYFPRPHKLFRGPVFAGCRRGFRLKPCPDTNRDVPRLFRGAESKIIGVLVRTVLQLGFTLQSSGKKRCGRRVGELRKWVSVCNESTGTTQSILVHANGPHSLVQESVPSERGRFI